jgi:GT2 family glycosyltransferase
MTAASPAKISVVVPIFGNEGDLPALVRALQEQTMPPDEILLVDGSPQPLAHPPPGTRLIHNRSGSQLGEDYHLGAKSAVGDFILFMQQDCVPEDKRALERLVGQLTPGRVSVVAQVTLPEGYFRSYNFWGQVLMARWLGCVRQGVSNKFDLHRRETIASIGWMETWPVDLAGEDMDLFMRLSERGEVCVSDVEIIHYHHQSVHTSAWDVIKRHYRLAESFGALFRKWGLRLGRVPYAAHWSHHLAKYLYALVFLLPFAPLPVGIVLFVGSNFCNFESWKVKSWKKLVLLLFNPCLFIAGFIGTILGFRYRPIWPAKA